MKMKSSYKNITETDGLTRYLDEIGRGSLLNKEQEIELSLRISEGDDEARERMITSNLRLVVTIAKGFDWSGLPLTDLVASGNIGLMKAVDRYDHSHGTRFSTYAAFWIKQYIRRCIEREGRTVRLPTHIHEKSIAVHRAESILHQEGLTPTTSEIARLVGLPEKTVDLVRSATRPVLSMDAPIEGEDGTQFGCIAETIGTTPGDDPASITENSDLCNHLATALQRLDARSRKIVTARFGLDGETPRTLSEIGDGIGISRERVRQICNEALKTLHTMINSLPLISSSNPHDFGDVLKHEACAA